LNHLSKGDRKLYNGVSFRVNYSNMHSKRSKQYVFAIRRRQAPQLDLT